MKQYFKPHEILTKKEPADLGMVYTSVQRVEVGSEPVTLESGAEELCFICIGGRVDYQTEGQSDTAVQMDMLYLPIESSITFTSSEGGVLMRYGAPCTRKTKFGHIRFADVDKDSRHKVYGKVENGTRRDVWNYIDESFDSSPASVMARTAAGPHGRPTSTAKSARRHTSTLAWAMALPHSSCTMIWTSPSWQHWCGTVT